VRAAGATRSISAARAIEGSPPNGNKRHVLKPMELAEPPQIEAVDPPKGRKRGTYGDPSLRLRFRGRGP
jgi:hypothetical protein